jgi:hypothetical protein
MKCRYLICLALAAFGATGIAHAHGDVKCDAPPKAEWRPQMELQKKLVEAGWRVRQVKTFNDCYEVYGFDEKGARAEAFFHPKTFEKVGEVKQ